MAKHRFARLMGILFGAPPGAGEGLPGMASDLTRLEHFAHFWVHVSQSFVRNRCLVRASALSFSTLLALIPMLAVAISVTSSLLKSQGEAQIYEAINKLVATMVPPGVAGTNHPSADTNMAPAVLAGMVTNVETAPATNAVAAEGTNPGTNAVATGTNAVMAGTGPGEDDRVITAQKEAARSIHDFVQNTRSGALGMVGMLLLVWVAISMLANIEATFNDIWGVTRGRNWLWRIVLYWATLTLGPLALVGAYSLAGLHLEAARQIISGMPLIGSLIFEGLPLVIVWLVFSLIYLTVPNTKVRWGAALAGGMVAGSVWYLNNLLGYLYVSRVVGNSMIYGSLGLLPVFMAGLYFSWVILLFGVQVSYAFQNRESYLQDKFAENVNQRGREFIALRLMTCLGLRYHQGRPPATAQQIATELGISTRLTQQIVQTLLAARLITEVAGTEAAYCPARPLEAINAHQVLQAVRLAHNPVVYTREEPVRDEIYGEFARIEEAERVAAASVTMLALVNRARMKLEPPAIDHPAVTPALPPPASEVPETEPAMVVELIMVPPAETVAGAVKTAAAPVQKPARKIAVPEDNHDFPL